MTTLRSAPIACVLLAACATSSSDRRQPIAVMSRTPGAAILVEGREVARTPASVVVRTDVPLEIKIVAGDGRVHTCHPKATPEAGLVALQSMLTPLWVGLVVDSWTGAWNELEPRCVAPW